MRRAPLLLLALAGCSAPAARPQVAPATRAPVGGAPEQAAPSAQPALRPAGFVLADASGVRRMNPDGSLAAILSEDHAVAARWIGDSDALVFLDGMGRLVQLDGSGDEHIVATVPLALPCPSDAFSEPELGLHMDEEFWITADGSHACLSLSDAFPNMRNVERQVAVRLSDGHVRAQLFLGGDECGQPQAQESIDVCATRPSPTWPEVDSPLPGGAVHSVSPDGA